MQLDELKIPNNKPDETVILELVENAPHNAFIFSWIAQKMDLAPSSYQTE